MIAMLLRCVCGQGWHARGDSAPAMRRAVYGPCPGCGENGYVQFRMATIIGDPTRELAWIPAATRPPAVLRRWSLTADRMRLGNVVVSMLALTRGRDVTEETAYEIVLDLGGGFVEALAFMSGGCGGEISVHEVPPMIMDLARTIVLDQPPVTDWQAFARAAVLKPAKD